MNYTILVHSPFERRSLHLSALAFAQALLQAGHSIHRIFFYGDAVSLLNGASVCPQDETDVLAAWQQLIEGAQLDAVVCISAAVKRGILDAAEARRYDKSATTLAASFQLSGLGQLVEAMSKSDRVVSFS